MPSDATVSEPRRLHPVSLLFNLLQGLRAMAIPLVTVLLVGQGAGWMRWALPFMAFGVIVQPVVTYLVFRYRFGREGLVVRDGLLTRNERNIPYARIQNVDIVQNPLHRAFGVAIVKLETASGGTPEAVIRVLSLDAVLEMRRRVAEGRGLEPPSQLEGAEEAPRDRDEGQSVAHSTSRDLVVHGLVANRGMIVFGAVLGTIWQAGADQFLERFLERVADVSFLDMPSPRAAAQEGAWLYLTLLVGFSVALFVLALLGLSIAWSLVKYGGFELRLVGNDLRARYGLFTRVQASIPRRRVQRVIIHQRLVHRAFGRISAYADTAGSGSGGEGDPVSAERLWLAPAVDDERERRLCSAALGAGWNPDALEWRPLDPRASQRLIRRSWIVTALLSALVLAVPGLSGHPSLAWVALAPLPLGGLLHLRAHLFVRHSAWALSEGFLVHRWGVLSRRTVIVRLNKVQVVRTGESPFDRRWGMASLLVDTAGSAKSQTHGIEIGYLEKSVADQTAEALRAASARTDFLW